MYIGRKLLLFSEDIPRDIKELGNEAFIQGHSLGNYNVFFTPAWKGSVLILFQIYPCV
jgi:hypothetical protein